MTMTSLENVLQDITSVEFITQLLDSITSPQKDLEWHEMRAYRTTLRKFAPSVALWRRLTEEEKTDIATRMKQRLEQAILNAFSSSLSASMLDNIY